MARESEVRRLALDGELDRLRRDGAEHARDALAARAEAEAARLALALAESDAQRARQLAGQRKREAEQALSIAMLGLRRVREDVDRVGQSTAWRIGHRAARTFNRMRLQHPKTSGAVAAAIDRLDDVLEMLAARRGEAPSENERGVPRPDPGHRPDSDTKRALAAKLRGHLGSVPERPSWPGVSILVLNRNGEALLGALLEGLRATDYPALEMVVIDHASTDGSVELLGAAGLPFPVRIRRKDANQTLAVSANEAAELAEHPLLLFLDNDVEPFEPGWLKELVDGLLASDSGAMGGTLLRATLDESADPPSAGFAVQQRGIALARDGALARAQAADVGVGPLGAGLGVERACVAVAGSCLLVQRTAFEGLGGFDTAYRYGHEDLDLALGLISAGRRVACSGRAVLFHEDAATKRNLDAGDLARNRLANDRRLAERWGPALRRELRLALARCDRAWVGDEAMHVAMARVSNDPENASADHFVALELGGALAALGWRVSYLERREGGWYSGLEDVDAVVALTEDFDPRRLPSRMTAVAWIRGGTARWLETGWLDRYDILLAGSAQTAATIAAADGRKSTVFPLAANPSRFSPTVVDPQLESDYALAGHRREHERAIEYALDPRPDERPAIYGNGWEEVDAVQPYRRGAAPYDRLASVYASTNVVIDDTAGPASDGDVLDGSVFAALAAGAIVTTNCARGARELFDDEFPVWSGAPSLRAQLDELLGAPETRTSLAQRYRRVVLTRHTYGHRAELLRELIVAADERLSFCVKIGAPDWESAARWGDQYLAQDLVRALKRRGHRCLIQVKPEWDNLEGLSHDVVVHLRGRSTYSPHPGQFNVLWLLSHPDELSIEEASSFDLVCVASTLFAQRLRERIAVPVAVLEQATDPWRFYPDPDPTIAHDLVFVGNTRGDRRPILDQLLPVDHDLAVWGSGLHGTAAARYLKGEWFANEELRRVYSSAKITLCDHWEDMRVNGFVSNRIYDAVACGSVVVSDAVAGLDGRFGDAVVAYETADELRSIIDELLGSDEERRRRIEGARDRIIRSDTFDHRAAELIRLVEQHAGTRGKQLRLTAA